MCQKLWWKDSLTLFLLKESAWIDKLVSHFGNIHFHTIHRRTWSSESPSRYKKVTLKQIGRLPSLCFLSIMWKKSWHTHTGMVNRSAIANDADYFLCITRVFLSASFWSKHPVTSCHCILYYFLAYSILFFNVRFQGLSYLTFNISHNELKQPILGRFANTLFNLIKERGRRNGGPTPSFRKQL